MVYVSGDATVCVICVVCSGWSTKMPSSGTSLSLLPLVPPDLGLRPRNGDLTHVSFGARRPKPTKRGAVAETSPQPDSLRECARKTHASRMLPSAVCIYMCTVRVSVVCGEKGPTMQRVPNWHLQCYTYNRHSGGQCLDRAGTGVLSAFQCPALVWHWSVQCPPVSCFPMALQCPSAPVPHRNGHPKSKFRVGEGRQCQEMRLLRRN